VAQPSGQQASFGKVLQNLVPMVGIEYLF